MRRVNLLYTHGKVRKPGFTTIRDLPVTLVFTQIHRFQVSNLSLKTFELKRQTEQWTQELSVCVCPDTRFKKRVFACKHESII